MNYTVAVRSNESPHSYEDMPQRAGSEPFPNLIEEVLESIETYGHENPWTFGLWMMGIGFVLGWKLKFW